MIVIEIVDSIGVRILPEMRGFRATLEKEIRKIDTSVSVDIEIGKVDTSKAKIQMAKFQEFVEARELELRAVVDVDTRAADRALKALDGQAKKVEKSADGSSGSLIGLTTSALKLGAGVGSTALKIGALSGALIGLTTIGSTAVTAVAQLVPIIGLLPAIAVAGAVAIGALKLGLTGFSEALKNMGDPEKFEESLKGLAPAARDTARALRDLKGPFDELRLGVQEALFFDLAQRIKDLGSDLLPKMRAPLEGIAKVFNGMATDVIAFLKQESTWSDLQIVFQGTEGALKNIRQALFPILEGLKDIGAVGAQMLPELTSGFGQAAQKFQDWASRVRETGELEQLINQAIDQFGKLFDIVGNVAGIIGSVFQAGAASGGSLLTILEKLTGYMDDFFNSAEGAQLLENIFTAIGGVMKGLLPLIAEVARVVAEFIGPALLKLGPAIGLALNALKPAIEPLGKALAALAPLIGTVAYQFAKILGAAIIALGPVIEALVPPVIELVQVFGKLITGGIEALAPVLLSLAQVISGVVLAALQALMPVLPVFIDSLKTVGEVLGGAIKEALPTLIEVAKTLGEGLLSALLQIIPLLPQLVDSFVGVLSAIIPLLPEMAKLVGEALPQLISLLPELIPMLLDLTEMWVGLVKDVTPFVSILVDRLIPVFGDVKDAVVEFIDGIKPIFEGIALWVEGTVDLVAGLLTGDFTRAFEGAGKMVEGVVKGIGGVLDTLVNVIKVPVELAIKVVTSLFGDGTSEWSKKIRGWVDGLGSNVFSGLGNLLVGAGKALIGGFIDGIRQKFNEAKQIVGGLMDTLRGLFPFSPAKEGAFSGKGYTLWSGRALAEDFAKGIEQNAYLAEREVDAMMTAAQAPLNGFDGNMGEMVEGSVDHAIRVDAGFAREGVADAVREGLSEATFTIDQNGVFKVAAQGGLRYERR